MVPPGGFTTPVWAPCMTIPFVIGVNPLQTTWLERGIVSGRVALLLRSAEILPLFERFVEMAYWLNTDNAIHPPPYDPPTNKIPLYPSLPPLLPDVCYWSCKGGTGGGHARGKGGAQFGSGGHLSGTSPILFWAGRFSFDLMKAFATGGAAREQARPLWPQGPTPHAFATGPL